MEWYWEQGKYLPTGKPYKYAKHFMPIFKFNSPLAPTCDRVEVNSWERSAWIKGKQENDYCVRVGVVGRICQERTTEGRRVESHIWLEFGTFRPFPCHCWMLGAGAPKLCGPNIVKLGCLARSNAGTSFITGKSTKPDLYSTVQIYTQRMSMHRNIRFFREEFEAANVRYGVNIYSSSGESANAELECCHHSCRLGYNILSTT